MHDLDQLYLWSMHHQINSEISPILPPLMIDTHRTGSREPDGMNAVNSGYISQALRSGL